MARGQNNHGTVWGDFLGVRQSVATTWASDQETVAPGMLWNFQSVFQGFGLEVWELSIE